MKTVSNLKLFSNNNKAEETESPLVAATGGEEPEPGDETEGEPEQEVETEENLEPEEPEEEVGTNIQGATRLLFY